MDQGAVSFLNENFGSWGLFNTEIRRVVENLSNTTPFELELPTKQVDGSISVDDTQYCQSLAVRSDDTKMYVDVTGTFAANDVGTSLDGLNFDGILNDGQGSNVATFSIALPADSGAQQYRLLLQWVDGDAVSHSCNVTASLNFQDAPSAPLAGNDDSCYLTGP